LWDAFSKAGFGITIENVPITGDKFEKLNSMFASGDPPDTFNTSDVNWCKDRELALAQHVELDGFIERVLLTWGVDGNNTHRRALLLYAQLGQLQRYGVQYRPVRRGRRALPHG